MTAFYSLTFEFTVSPNSFEFLRNLFIFTATYMKCIVMYCKWHY